MSEISQWDGKIMKPLFRMLRKTGLGTPIVQLALKIVEYVGNGPSPKGRYGKRIKWTDFDRIILTGQSHLDAAWRWRTKQGIIKARATFKKALKHIDELPTFTYSQPSPQYYQWMKESDPDYIFQIFPGIKEAIKKGRWVPTGGCWVEPDTNVPSGEALVRQRLYGQRFYLDEFGVMSDMEFLQDCFGFNRNLPQIFKKSGAKIFGTGKLFWNENAKIPIGMAKWQSPDGTMLPIVHINFGYFIPITMGKDYPLIYFLGKPGKELVANYQTKPKEFQAWRSDEYMMEQPFGYGLGDGGHGPIEAELTVVETMRKLYPKKIKHHQKGDFIAMFRKYIPRWATWTDEWYLDQHRGTYTSVSRVKRGNRDTENIMEWIESLAATLSLYQKNSSLQPELEKYWKLVCYNQFHDILPGSSCPEVYLDYDIDRKKIDDYVSEISKTLWAILISNAGVNPKYGTPLVIFNSLSWDRKGILEINIGSQTQGVIRNHKGEILPTFIVSNEFGTLTSNSKENLAITPVNMLPLGLAMVYFDESIAGETNGNAGKGGKLENPVSLTESDGSIVIENDNLRATIDKKTGWVGSLVSKVNNQEILAGPSNRILIFEEKKHTDAWNIDPDYMKYPVAFDEEKCSVSIIENTPVRSTIKVERTIGESVFYQFISLSSVSDMIDTTMDIDMKTKEVMVKLDFHTNLKTNIVSSEIPYAFIDRTIKPTTMIDKARWEQCGQKWCSIHDEGKDLGFTILNNGKYAYNAIHSGDGTVHIRPTVVRTPRYTGYASETLYINRAPDGGIDLALPRNTDLEFHRDIAYSFGIHKGNWQQGVWKKAYNLNFPLQYNLADFTDLNPPSEERKGSISLGAQPFSALKVNLDTVRVGAFKVCEDNPDPDNPTEYIIRLVEVAGSDCDAEVSFDESFTIKDAQGVNLLELEEKGYSQPTVKGNSFSIRLTPYEISTIKITIE